MVQDYAPYLSHRGGAHPSVREREHSPNYAITALFGRLDQNFKCYKTNSFVNNARSEEVKVKKTQGKTNNQFS